MNDEFNASCDGSGRSRSLKQVIVVAEKLFEKREVKKSTLLAERQYVLCRFHCLRLEGELPAISEKCPLRLRCLSA